MKKYKFKLETVLNLKKQLEQNLKNRLANEISKLNSEKAILDDYIDSRKQFVISYEKNNSNHTSICQIMSCYEYLAVLDEKVNLHQQRMAEIQLTVNSILQELTIAAKEKQTMIKLEEKEFATYKYELMAEEQKTNDENNSYKYYKKTITSVKR